jgi:hypothetical protein
MMTTYIAHNDPRNVTSAGLQSRSGQPATPETMRPVAPLWGNTIPITYGKRRIAGQIMQLGSARQVTETTQNGTVNKLVCNICYSLGENGFSNVVPTLAKLWIGGKLIYSIESGKPLSDVKYTFYPGGETQQSDQSLRAATGAADVTYRDLMHVVISDFPLQVNGVASDATLEAELWDNPVTTRDVELFDTSNFVITGAPYTRCCFYDKFKNIYYNLGNDNKVYKFDCNTSTLVSVTPLTHGEGVTPSAQPYSQAGANVVPFFDAKRNDLGGAIGPPQPYIIVQTGFTTFRKLYVIDLEQAQVVSTYGEDGFGLAETETRIGQIVASQGVENLDTAFSFAMQGLVVITAAGVIHELGVSFDKGRLFLTRYSQLAKQPLFVGLNARSVTTSKAYYSLGASQRDLGQYFAYVAVGNKVVRYVAHSRQPSLNKFSVFYQPVDWFTSTGDVFLVYYVKANDTVLVFESFTSGSFTWRVSALDGPSQAVLWSINSVTNPGIIFPQSGTNSWLQNSNFDDEKMKWRSSTDTAVYTLNMLSGTTSITELTNFSLLDNLPIYDIVDDKLISAKDDKAAYTKLSGLAAQLFPLNDLLRDICLRRGYTNANITITGIDDQIEGAAITTSNDVNVTLYELARLYDFSIITQGDKITLTRRDVGFSGTVDGTILESERGIVGQDDDAFITVKSERYGGAETPGKVIVNFIDPNADYTVNAVQHVSTVSGVDASQAVELSVPIIMSAQVATALAIRQASRVVTGKVQHEFIVPRSYMRMLPGDIYNLQFKTFTDTVRIKQATYNADYSITAIGEVAATSGVVNYTADPIIIVPQPNPLAGTLDVLPIDVPSLFSTPVTEFTLYLATVPADRFPPGTGAIIKSVAGGVPTVIGASASVLSGSLSNNINNAEPCTFDAEATLVLQFTSGDPTTIASTTYLLMLDGENRVFVGTTGRWEVIGYQTVAVDLTAKTITLTGLARGLRGTDANTKNHAIGDAVVFFDDITLPRDSAAYTAIGLSSVYDVINTANKGSVNGPTTFVERGNTIKPWAVNNVRCFATGADVTISWTRRTKVYGPLIDGSPTVPLDEVAELYDLVIYRAGLVVRTVSAHTASTFVYTAAMQTADGWSGSIKLIELDVYQLNDVVGRGFARQGVYDVQ